MSRKSAVFIYFCDSRPTFTYYSGIIVLADFRTFLINKASRKKFIISVSVGDYVSIDTLQEMTEMLIYLKDPMDKMKLEYQSHLKSLLKLSNLF